MVYPGVSSLLAMVKDSASRQRKGFQAARAQILGDKDAVLCVLFSSPQITLIIHSHLSNLQEGHRLPIIDCVLCAVWC